MVLFFRLPIQVFFWVLEWIFELSEDLSYSFIYLFRKPEYVRQGGCAGTGQCCQAIGLKLPRFLLKSKTVITLFRKWHYLRYNFRCIGLRDDLMVYECMYLQPDKSCGIQAFKPKLCRDFPKLPLFGFTRLHKGCGFSFQRRGSVEFDRLIDDAKEREQDVSFDV